jgi:archaellum component FlaG (FlaF/FlaG flagellin family)
MPSASRLVLLVACLLVLALMASCVARNVADTAKAMREQQCRNLARPLVGDVEVTDGGKAQGRADVHAVKAASPDARAA